MQSYGRTRDEIFDDIVYSEEHPRLTKSNSFLRSAVRAQRKNEPSEQVGDAADEMDYVSPFRNNLNMNDVEYATWKKEEKFPISNPHSSYNTLKPEELGYKQKFPKKYAREIHFPAELTENEMRQRAILQDLDEKEQHLDHLKKSQRVVYIDKPVEKEDVVREPVDIQKVPKIPYSEYGQCNEAEFRNPVATPETPEEVVIYKHLNGTNKAYSKEIFDNIQRDICNHNAWLLSREGKANDQCATKMEEYNKQLAVLDDQIKSEKAAMNNLRRKQQRAIDLNENRLTKTFLLQTQQFTAEKNKIYKETERLNFAIRKHQDKNRQGILPDDASHDTVTVEETVLDKLTSTITNAAQSAQDTIHNTILSPDAQTKLQFLKTTRYFQEKVGTISEDEIAKLPEGYQRLQEKSEAMEKVLKRLLVVTKTFELEGYDYPPNVTESLNHWWNEDENKKKKTQDFGDSSILNRSFAIAIGKAVLDSQYILSDLKEQQKTRGTEEKKVKREEEAEAAEEEDEADDGEQEAEDEEEEEEDIDMNNMISAFGLWSNCYKNIDQSKAEMDSMIVKEFNQKLTDMLEIDFKTVHKLCTRVQDSRLEFDTLRHKLKLKELEKEARRQVMEEVAEQQAEASGEPVEKEKVEPTEPKEERKSTTEEAEKTSASENDSSKKSGKASGKSKKGKETAEEPQTEPKEAPPAAEAKEEPPAKETAPAKESNEAEEEENKLLERLEDEFVSNITAAVEKMTELTDSSELISLVKLFQNIQLVHYRQCVQELEASMKSLDELEAESLFE